MGLLMACSNTFGLVTGAFLLGFGLSEIPKSIWRNADWDHRQKVLSHRVAKMAVSLDNAHQEFSNTIVVIIFIISSVITKIFLLCFDKIKFHQGVGKAQITYYIEEDEPAHRQFLI